MLADPAIPLWITEGVKKADCGALHGLCIVALSGVWNWLGTNSAGGKMALPDWHDIALNGRRVIMAFDGDVARKQPVQKALHALAGYLAYQGCQGRVPAPARHRRQDRAGRLPDGRPHRRGPVALVKPTPAAGAPRKPASSRAGARAETRTGATHFARPRRTPCSAAGSARTTTPTRWTPCSPLPRSRSFDDGSDPVWLLIISGPAAAKTETVQALDGTGAIDHQHDHSEAALLSATPKRERAKDATGGLLRKIGERGLLVIKDVTSILSMNSDTRAKVLAALREVYDGRWDREVGADGGRHPRLGRPHRRRRRGHHRLGHPPRRHRHDGRPVRPGPHRLHQGQDGRRPPGDRQHRRRGSRCAPSWPRRWPASSPG